MTKEFQVKECSMSQEFHRFFGQNLSEISGKQLTQERHTCNLHLKEDMSITLTCVEKSNHS